MNRYLLLVREDRVTHIARHGVTLEEVEEVFYGPAIVDRARSDRRDIAYRLIGQMHSGRHLTIFIAEVQGGVYALTTARNATDAEQRLFRQRRRN